MTTPSKGWPELRETLTDLDITDDAEPQESSEA